MLAPSPRNGATAATINAAFPLCPDPGHAPAIRRVLAHCVEFLQSRLPAPELVAVVLTGSFARGEGSVMPVNGHLQVLGDLEFFVIVSPDTDTRALRPQMAAWSREVSGTIGEGLRTEIEFGPIELGYFARHARPSIFLYDLLTHGRVVWGPPDVLDTIPRFGPATIPREDCLALLFNRSIEQLDLYDRLATLTGDALSNAAYQRIKLVLDIAGSALAFSGRHSPCYAARPAAFARLVAETPSLQALVPDGFELELGRAARTKLTPGEGTTLVPPGASLRGQRAWIRSQILSGIPAVAAFIRWELEELVGRRANLPRLLDAYLGSQPLVRRARDWAKVALHPMPTPLPVSLRRALRLSFVSTPRALLYAAGTLALLDLLGPSTRAGRIEPLLFVRAGAVPDDPESQRKAIAALWRWCVRNN